MQYVFLEWPSLIVEPDSRLDRNPDYDPDITIEILRPTPRAAIAAEESKHYHFHEKFEWKLKVIQRLNS